MQRQDHYDRVKGKILRVINDSVVVLCESVTIGTIFAEVQPPREVRAEDKIKWQEYRPGVRVCLTVDFDQKLKCWRGSKMMIDQPEVHKQPVRSVEQKRLKREGCDEAQHRHTSGDQPMTEIEKHLALVKSFFASSRPVDQPDKSITDSKISANRADSVDQDFQKQRMCQPSKNLKSLSTKLHPENTGSKDEEKTLQPGDGIQSAKKRKKSTKKKRNGIKSDGHSTLTSCDTRTSRRGSCKVSLDGSASDVSPFNKPEAVQDQKKALLEVQSLLSKNKNEREKKIPKPFFLPEKLESCIQSDQIVCLKAEKPISEKATRLTAQIEEKDQEVAIPQTKWEEMKTIEPMDPLAELNKEQTFQGKFDVLGQLIHPVPLVQLGEDQNEQLIPHRQTDLPEVVVEIVEKEMAACIEPSTFASKPETCSSSQPCSNMNIRNLEISLELQLVSDDLSKSLQVDPDSPRIIEKVSSCQKNAKEICNDQATNDVEPEPEKNETRPDDAVQSLQLILTEDPQLKSNLDPGQIIDPSTFDQDMIKWMMNEEALDGKDEEIAENNKKAENDSTRETNIALTEEEWKKGHEAAAEVDAEAETDSKTEENERPEDEKGSDDNSFMAEGDVKTEEDEGCLKHEVNVAANVNVQAEGDSKTKTAVKVEDYGSVSGSRRAEEGFGEASMETCDSNEMNLQTSEIVDVSSDGVPLDVILDKFLQFLDYADDNVGRLNVINSFLTSEAKNFHP